MRSIFIAILFLLGMWTPFMIAYEGAFPTAQPHAYLAERYRYQQYLERYTRRWNALLKLISEP